ncbi:hypothetical protein E4U03_05400 [Rothia nasimurium]|uniref:Uncharacterized protein n=1 Tax=Rothia nasimurium TaxID=85336 RepID=A0A4Y9F3V6_9MICC|nr:hypothetical protein [Rothia nasimurium]MBF0808047.1 hypothetical protein [Rothia nasimurium]TFU22626.1 hypothetical protein E4U03_05400 [Rothia nasimurium]
MTEQTIQSRPPVQQASEPYYLRRVLGYSWLQTLTITALFTALAASLIFQAHLLNMVLVFCCVAFGFYISRRRASAKITLPISYGLASQTVFAVAVLALLFPGLDDPASATWRLPLLAVTTFFFHRFVTPGYHLIEEKKASHG